MFLALREMRRTKARFGLVVAAVALLVFLIFIQLTLQNGLLTAFVGAIRNQSAPVLVYSVDGRRNLQGSVITPPLEAAITAVPEVGRIDIACDWDWRPVCAIETVEVRVMPFEAMDEDMVPDQGEFADLADWRRGYRAYLERSVGFRPGIEMVVERFRVVEVFA